MVCPGEEPTTTSIRPDSSPQGRSCRIWALGNMSNGGWRLDLPRHYHFPIGDYYRQVPKTTYILAYNYFPLTRLVSSAKAKTERSLSRINLQCAGLWMAAIPAWRVLQPFIHCVTLAASHRPLDSAYSHCVVMGSTTSAALDEWSIVRRRCATRRAGSMIRATVEHVDANIAINRVSDTLHRRIPTYTRTAGNRPCTGVR